MMTFNEMNINNGIKMALEDMGFISPTPIQNQVIPLILDNRDVIAQAPTGTGKTCAFGIPVINNIDLTLADVQALILCPTRELVIQTENELKDVAKYSKDIRIVSIYGGQNIDRQLAGLRKKPQIVIGTTGRIMDHIRRKSLKLGSIKALILDEVDEMLDMGFREDIDVILETVPATRQTVLFSATMPKEIIEISKRYQDNPVSVKTQHEESDIPNINQYYVTVSESEKTAALVSIMRDKNYRLALVFCNTKKRVDELSMHLNALGLNSDALHGDLRQHNRDKTMKKFRSGETQVLIATDVAARGIDVDDIEAIFNFDAPHDEEYYVHRIGRTARANKTGDAYTFVSDRQMHAIKNFERYTKNPILKAEIPGTAFEKSVDKKLFDRTIKLVKKGGLNTYKDFLAAELESFKEKHSSIELLDIAASLLLQLNEAEIHKNTALSDPPRIPAKAFRATAKDARGGSKTAGVKFFMNIGTRDKCDDGSIKKFIVAKTGIPADNIISINCLENFSFASVKEGNNDLMESLNGLKYNNRFLAVEVAGNDKGKKTDRPKKATESAEGDKFKKPGRPRKTAESVGDDNFKNTDRPKKTAESIGGDKFKKPGKPRKTAESAGGDKFKKSGKKNSDDKWKY